MIRTYLELPLRPGHADRLATTFERLRILDLSVAQPGCNSAELTVDESGGVAIVTASWDSLAAYQEWTNRSDRQVHSDALSAHLAEPLGASTVGGIFRIAAVGRRSPNDHEGEAE